MICGHLILLQTGIMPPFSVEVNLKSLRGIFNVVSCRTSPYNCRNILVADVLSAILRHAISSSIARDRR